MVMNPDETTRTVANLAPPSSEASCPALGLDLDGTIDEAPFFFQFLAERWPGKVFIITYRKDRMKAETDVKKFNVRYDELILVDSFAAKAKIVVQRGIEYYFDDQDEMTSGIPESVKVFKIRNGGNFNFALRKWMYSDQTGIRI